MLPNTHTHTHTYRRTFVSALKFSAFSCFAFCICIIAIYCKSVCKNMPEIQSIQRLQLEETPQPPSLSLYLFLSFADRGQRLFELIYANLFIQIKFTGPIPIPKPKPNRIQRELQLIKIAGTANVILPPSLSLLSFRADNWSWHFPSSARLVVVWHSISAVNWQCN